MAIKISRIERVAGGACAVKLVQDHPNTAGYFQSVCRDRGWEVGPPTAIEGAPILIFDVRGSTPEEIRSALAADAEFDVSAPEVPPGTPRSN